MGKGSPGRRKGLRVSGRQGTGAELGACRPRVACVRSLGCLAWAGQRQTRTGLCLWSCESYREQMLEQGCLVHTLLGCVTGQVA